MYIFSRTRQARPDKVLDAIPSAIEIAQKVTTITGMEVHVWSVRFGQPTGTIMWSARIDSQAELFESTEKMMADATYLDMAMSLADQFEGPATDQLVRIVSGTPSEAPAKFISTTQAVMANGNYAKAIEFGVKMQEFVAKSLDQPTVFGTATYGGFADVIWLTGADSMAEVDAGTDWQNSDADYHKLVESAGGLFVEGSGQNGLLERLT
jgi:hypothetical protein